MPTPEMDAVQWGRVLRQMTGLEPCRKCGLYPATRVPVACPDNKPGCCVAHYRFAECPVCALLAHLQRQGTPVVVTEAMVEAAARAQYELEHTDLPWERCGSLFADGYREDARAVLTAALAARGEGE